jgi:hypothetical protein
MAARRALQLPHCGSSSQERAGQTPTRFGACKAPKRHPSPFNFVPCACRRRPAQARPRQRPKTEDPRLRVHAHGRMGPAVVDHGQGHAGSGGAAAGAAREHRAGLPGDQPQDVAGALGATEGGSAAPPSMTMPLPLASADCLCSARPKPNPPIPGAQPAECLRPRRVLHAGPADFQATRGAGRLGGVAEAPPGAGGGPEVPAASAVGPACGCAAELVVHLLSSPEIH